jgi:hypothetical protein
MKTLTTYVPAFLIAASLIGASTFTVAQQHDHDRIFPTPADARKSPAEKLAYVVATYAGTGIKQPDYLASRRRPDRKLGDIIDGRRVIAVRRRKPF